MFQGGAYSLGKLISNPDPELKQRILTLVRESGADTPVAESTVRELADQLSKAEGLINEARDPINRLLYYKTVLITPFAVGRNRNIPRFRVPTEDTPVFEELKNNFSKQYVDADRAAGVFPDFFAHAKKASALAIKVIFLDALDNVLKLADSIKASNSPFGDAADLNYLKGLREAIQKHPGWTQVPFYNPNANLPPPSSNPFQFQKQKEALLNADILRNLDEQLKLGAIVPSLTRNSPIDKALSGLADAVIKAKVAGPDAAIQSASSALKGLLKYAEEQVPQVYKGQHPVLLGGANPIAFSRFSEHTADIPELGTVKGIYVNELQSDLLQDVRRGGVKGRTLDMDNAELDRLAKEESALRKRLGTGARAQLLEILRF